jgi:hypothetical protein
VVLLAYANAFGLGLAFDGILLAEKDPRTHGASLANIRQILTTPYWWPDTTDTLYRPLTTLSFLANFVAFENGVRPFAYHATNILLHLVNAWLVFALARRVLKSIWPAFFAAAIWAAHPVGTDTVTNIAGRADLLAAAGLLGALLLYLDWRSDARSPWLRLAGIFLLALLAAGAKETGAMLIGLMLLSDLVPAFRPKVARNWRAAAYGAVAVALGVYLALRMRAFAGAPAVVPAMLQNPLHAASFWTARWTALKILALEIGLLVWPARLASDRSFDAIPFAGALDPAAWIGLAIAAALAATVLFRRSRPNLFWLAGFFSLLLLPASNLVVLIGAPMAERFLYLPSAAFAIAVAALAWRFAPPRAAAAALTTVTLLFAARSLARNPDWNSNRTLAARDVQTVPRSFRMRQLLGEELYVADRRNLPETIRHLETSWSILDPVPPEQSTASVPAGLATYHDLAAAQAGRGTPVAREHFARSLDLLQRAAVIARAQERIYDDAQARQGKPVPPRRPNQSIFLFLGAHYLEFGRYDDAIRAFREGRGIDPTSTGLYDAAVGAWLAAGRPEMAALTQLEWAIAVEPTPAVLDAVESLYAKLPDGACAVKRHNDVPSLDFDCPRLRADVCRAAAEVEQTYIEARRPDRARGIAAATAPYGCAAR